MSSDVGQEIGRRLRELREQPLDPVTGAALPRLTRRELAARLDGAPGTVEQHESGKRKPELDTIRRWAEACGYALQVDFVPLHAQAQVLRLPQGASPELRQAARLLLLAASLPRAEVLIAIERALTELAAPEQSEPGASKALPGEREPQP